MADVIRLKACYVLVMGLSFQGGARYEHTEFEQEKDGEELREQWRTDKRVFDVSEYNKGRALKETIRRKLIALGAPGSLGIVIPRERGKERTEQVIAECKALVRDYNTTATFSRLRFYPVLFEPESGIAESVAASLAEKLGEISKALEAGSVKDVRQLLRDTDNYENLFTGEVSSKISMAFTAARGEARRLAAAAREYERTAQQVEVQVRTSQIDVARAMFIEALAGEERGIDTLQVDLVPTATIEVIETQVKAGNGFAVNEGETLFM